MTISNVQIDIGNGRTVTIETGKMAALANGAVTVQQGDTLVFVPVCCAAPRPGIDFFPLTVDYRERFSASGIFPGGHFKREGRPSEKETLTSRMTDRPLRPLFPEGFINEIQILSLLLSCDNVFDGDVLSILGASAALTVSDIPFNGPIGAVRVGRVNGEFIANPSEPERVKSDLDLVYAGSAGKVIMIEGSANELSEEVIRDAFYFADGIVRKMIDAQNQLRAQAGKPKIMPKLHAMADDVYQALCDYCAPKIEAACTIPEKTPRYAALDALCKEMIAALTPKFSQVEGADQIPWKMGFDKYTEASIRRLILDKGQRSDGRAADALRPISCEVGVLPRVHGSSLFARGETQALVTVTLGSEKNSQYYDDITAGFEGKKKYMLHYNFPPYSVGECGRSGTPGRREIGHGNLAERCVICQIPKEFPYAVRIISEIMASNGSTSQASICGASLALMDAGVPMKKLVAGISVGLISEGDKRIYLTDIIGSEDHYGDMDFKVGGTRDGITGFQLDLKIAGLDIEGMYVAMKQNKIARSQILDIMEKCIAAPRPKLSPFAPQVELMNINPEKIGALIGPGGKHIKSIVEATHADIDVTDDGTVKIFASNRQAMEEAIRQVSSFTAEAEVGRTYRGKVRTIREFGAFVEIMPGIDGMVHISELADYRVKTVEEICKVGEDITVKCIGIDDRGKIRLSRKEALAEM
jgi:polyribonucleotide nucleotidyltransferase